MTRDGDGDYWRREDVRRAQLDRAFWRDYERRCSREREVREYETRRRGLGSADGPLRDGDTTAALRNFAGPDAAANDQRVMRAELRSQKTTQMRTRDVVVAHLPEPVDSVEHAPPAVALDAGQPYNDGDIPVGAEVGKRAERGWVRRRRFGLARLVAVPPRTREMIAALVERGDLFGYRRSMPWTDLPSPFDASLGESPRREPH